MERRTVEQILELVKNRKLSAKDAFNEILEEKTPAGTGDIAVVGMSGLFGGASDLDEFWDYLKEGRDCTREIPPDRWDMDGFYDPRPGQAWRSNCKWGSFLNNIFHFDPLFFKISPKEAELMDPQQRLFLQETWKALESAGLSSRDLKGRDCSVFAGYGDGDYKFNLMAKNIPPNAHYFMGNSGSILAARISYFLDLKGMALPLDTACSSSLIAIHLACESIRNGSCSLSIAGGVTLFTTPHIYYLTSSSGMLSSEGKCKAFDNSADGFVPGEGVGVIVLMSRKKAEAEGYPILGFIKGSGCNQDGNTNGITAPSSLSQKELICGVLDRYNISPDTISYVEGHGTGTRLGDPIEVNALSDAYRCYTGKKQYCAIGSVKSNIGHTQLAAGVAGVIKVLLCLGNKKLVPSLHVKNLNKHIDFLNSPFYVNRELAEWNVPPGIPRRASVSAFGFSGTNAHVILEEPPAGIYKEESDEPLPCLVPLSAKSSGSLKRQISRLIRFLQLPSKPGVTLKNIACTLQRGRTHFDYRAAFVADSLPGLIEQMKNAVLPERLPDSFTEKAAAGKLVDTLSSLPGKEGGQYRPGLEKLKTFYLAGYDPEWEKLYIPGKVRRVRLPSYSFDTEEYRIDGAGKKSHFVVNKETMDFYATRHIINSRKILPGVVYLDLAYRFARQVRDDSPRSVREMVWLIPYDSENAGGDLEVHLSPSGNSLKFTFLSPGDGKPSVHGKGVLCYDSLPPENLQRDLQKLRASFPGQKKTKEDHYNFFRTRGVFHGPFFRGVQWILTGEKSALGYIEMPVEAEKDPSFLSPSLTDSILQCITGVVDQSSALHLPFSFDVMELYKPPGKCVFVYVTKRENNTFDLEVMDTAGHVLLVIKKFIMKSFSGPMNVFLRSEWKEKPLEPREERKYPFLVIEEKGISLLNGKAEPFVLIRGEPGSPGTDKFKKAFRLLDKTVPEGIIFIIRKHDFSFMDDFSGFSPGNLFLTLKYLLDGYRELKKRPPVKLLVVIDEGDNPYHRALSGFIRTMAMEDPGGVYKMIILENGNSSIEELRSLCNAELSSSPEQEVLIRDGKRYVKVFREITDLETRGAGPLFREKGSYFISGGMGKIGFTIAGYLARKYKARLVIMGRSFPDGKIRQNLKLLEEMGGEASYFSGDISDPSRVKEVLEKMRLRFGKINGVIHGAGVNNDSYLKDKNEKEIMEVLAPKIRGTMVLDHNTKDDQDLDFFVLFSSITSQLGNPGQSDYAFANRFMDEFARYRENRKNRGEGNGKTLVINWPFWKNGGMAVDPGTMEFLTRVRGVDPLPDEEGLGILEKGIRLDHDQLMVMRGDRSKIEELIDRNVIRSDNPMNQVIKSGNGVSGKAVETICGIMSDFLKIPRVKIQPRKPFSDYGFDSISLTEFFNLINEKLNLKVMPSLYFEYPTPEAFAGYLSEKYSSRFVSVEEKPFSAPFKPPRETGEVVAIVGIAGRFPRADTVEEFWENLISNRDMITEIPGDRWNWADYWGDPGKEPGKTDIKWGGFMKGVDKFDPLFFGISPREAELMDPQQRLFLEAVRGAIEDAGHRPSELQNSSTGIFAGVSTMDYASLLSENNIPLDAYTTTGRAHSILANRVSYLFNFTGPSEPVDTACSSSLIAVHRGAASILAGECDQAIAGGVNVMVSPELFIAFSKAGMLSKNGRCKTFDESADGYARSEGVGAFFLKSLKKAQEDNDHIYAVIRGSAVNHGGRANSLTAPNPNAQADVIVKAFENGNIDPATVNYIEMHGTGTALGDPAEINGLKKAFRRLYENRARDFPSNSSCALGTVKSNAGHLEAAAGVAGLAKMLMAMKHGVFPGNLHLENLNPQIELDDSPFFLLTENRVWEPVKDPSGRRLPRRCGISSFGYGGANVHMVLEEYIPSREIFREGSNNIWLFSAKTEKSLLAGVSDMINWLKKEESGTGEVTAEILGVLPERFSEVFGNPDLNFANLLCGRERAEEFVNAVNAQYGLSLTVVDLFDYYTPRKLSAFIKKSLPGFTGEGGVSPWSIAFTLQTGRDEFQHRLAIVTDSVSRGRELLEKYAAGVRDDENIFTSELDEDYIPGGKWSEMNEMPASVSGCRALAEQWVQGSSIDWNSLYENPPRRLSLPLYSFSGERFWFTPEENTLMVKKEYVKILEPSAFYIKDHDIGGQTILPGVGYIHLVRELYKNERGESVRSMGDIMWGQPAVVKDSGIPVHIRLDEGKEQNGFSLLKKEAGNEILYARGRIFSSSGEQSEAFLIDEIKDRCKAVKNFHEIYDLFRSIGFSYGESFKVIRKACAGERECLSMLKLPERVDATLTPSDRALLFMDGALQTILCLGEERSADGIYIPFSLERIHFYSDVPPVCYAYVKSISGRGELKKFDVFLLDEKGAVILKMRNFCSRALKAPEKTRGPLRIYGSRWIEENTSEPLSSPAIILFAGTAGEGLLFRDYIEKSGYGGDISCVFPGDSFASPGEGLYSLNFLSKDDYAALSDKINKEGRAFSHCLFLASGTTGREDVYPLWRENMNRSIDPLLNLVSALESGKHNANVKCLYVMNGTRRDGYISPGEISAFARSLKFVSPWFSLSSVTLTDLVPGMNEIRGILGELIHAPAGQVASFKQGKYFVKRLFLSAGSLRPVTGNLKNRGRYWISGGLGALGHELASYLSSHYEADIILSGRSALDETKRTLLETIPTKNNHVEYLRGDLSREEEAFRLRGEIKDRFGKIDGVFHLAGVAGKAPVFQTSSAERDEIFESKIGSFINMDRALDKEALDFFIVYSSIASLLGDFGNCYYAIAGSMLNELAAIRNSLVSRGLRKGRTISIQWPYWKKGGMKLPDERKDAFLRFSGMIPLENETGFAILENILSGTENFPLVLSGEEVVLGSMLPAPEKEAGIAVPAVPENSLFEKTLDYLKEMFAEQSKIPIKKISVKSSLEAYGVDSMMIMDMNKRLEEDFSGLPQTLFFEYTNLQQLANYFVENHKDTLLKLFPPDHSGEKVVFSPVQVEEITPSGLPGEDEDKGHDIAVIGVSGQWPQARDVQEFWENLKGGKDCIEEVPLRRWDYRPFYDPTPLTPGKIITKWGGFIEDIDKFDAGFFNIIPRFAKMMDPQERIFLETTWHALENAGYTPERMISKKPENYQGDVGVFVGFMYDDYKMIEAEEILKGNFDGLSSYWNASIANRVSYQMNFNGPSYVLDTACSSSLMAIHQACESIHRKECYAAIAGGVSLSIHPTKYLRLSFMGMASPHGRCKSFGDDASGYVPGEAVGAVVLKPYKAAIKDGDTIWGVIKGSASNHCGKTNGYSVPNPNAQAAVISEAVKRSGVNARSIGYVETHGSGTALGDPIEVVGLSKSFSEHTNDRQFCAIGAVKSNIGHCEGGAGISAFVKTILQLRYKTLVPSIHSGVLNPKINFEKSQFFVQRELSPWNAFRDKTGGELPLRAGVSSFGAGGVNVHILLEEHKENRVSQPEESKELVLFSAASGEQLKVYVKSWMDALEKNEGYTLKQVAFTSQVGRVSLKHRLAFVVESKKELLEELRKFPGTEGSRFHSQISEVPGDEAGVEEALRRKDLEKLARFWIDGVEIDFSLLHSPGTGTIELPGYPFARTSYWLPVREGTFKQAGEPSVQKIEPPASGDTASAAVFASRQDDTTLRKDLRAETVRLLSCELEKIIQLPAEDIESGKVFSEFGIDSISITQFSRALTRLIPSVSETALFAYQSIDELTDFLASNHEEELKGILDPVTADKGIEPSSKNERESGLQASAASGKQVIAFLAEALSHVTQLPVEEIDKGKSFSEFGVDSISITQFSRKVLDKLPMVSDTALFAYQTLEELSEFLLSNYKEYLAFLPGMETPGDVNVEKRMEPVREKREEPVSKKTEPEHFPSASSDIAIIGLAGRFPGAADLDRFAENLEAKISHIREIAPSRWDNSAVYGGKEITPGKTYCKWGAFLDDIDLFDPLFFNITPNDASVIDPQERIMLETVWHLLEDAGYTRSSLSRNKKKYNRNVGVFIGITTATYLLLGVQEAMKGNNVFAGTSFASVANRISYFLDLNGPCMPIDAMCASSLVAVHEACQRIIRGECELAIAGGVNLYTHPYRYVDLSQAKLISADGKNRSFGKGGLGFVPGEGVGAVLLKPLGKAEADGDNIYAVIKGSAFNHSGRTNGYFVPNPQAQAMVIQKALDSAGWTPDDPDYLETQMVGSELTDAIELDGLAAVYGKRKNSIPLGCVKPNIGHAESASGMAQLTKVLLQMKRKSLFPTILPDELNPRMDLSGKPFYIQDRKVPWAGNAPLRAGISSFGAGGSGVHILIEEYKGHRNLIDEERKLRAYPVSAKTKEGVKRRVRDLSRYLANERIVSQDSIACTLQTGREHFDEGVVFLSETLDDLKAKLEAFLADRNDPGIILPGRRNTADALPPEILAVDWVEKKKTDWRSLYTALPRKVSLPLYPFQKRRCWVDIRENENKIPVKKVEPEGSLAEDFIFEVIRSFPVNGIPGKGNSLADLGLSSLLVSELLVLVSEKFDIVITPYDLGDNPEIAGLTALVEEKINLRKKVEHEANLDPDPPGAQEVAAVTAVTPAASGMARGDEVVQYLVDLVSGMMGLEKEELEIDRDLAFFGTSSLLLARVFAEITKKYGAVVTANDMTGVMTIGKLAKLIRGSVKVTEYQEAKQPDLKEADDPGKFVMLGGQLKLDHGVYSSPGGRSYEYFSIGQGPPILFVTALAFSHRIWQNQVNDFYKDHRVILVNLPGHGGSVYDGRPFTFGDIATELAGFIDFLCVSPVHLVAWCMGGNISQLLALEYPRKLKTMTLVCTTPADIRVRGIGKADLESYNENPLATYEYEFNTIYKGQPLSESSRIDEFIDLIVSAHTEVPGEAVIYYINELFSFDTRNRLKEISVPTLIISGKHDLTYTPEQVKKLGDGIKKSRYENFPLGGHMPFVNRSEKFNAILYDFINQKDKNFFSSIRKIWGRKHKEMIAEYGIK